MAADKSSHECPFCGGTMEPKAGVVAVDAVKAAIHKAIEDTVDDGKNDLLDAIWAGVDDLTGNEASS